MEVLDNAFFFVTDMIIAMMGFFTSRAWAIGRTVLFVSIALAAINYAINGEGLKDNAIKITKAVIFFVLVMGLYPQLMGRITNTAFQWAHGSIYSTYIQPYMEQTKEEIEDAVIANPTNGKKSPTRGIMRSRQVSENQDPKEYFGELIQRRESGADDRKITYTVVAPAAALRIVLLVAELGFDHARNAPKSGPPVFMPDLSVVVIGLLIGFAVILVGVFAVIEYLMAFLEFMLVASVGVILFPLSLWEGTKFMAEKLISAIIGFFLKLLFCNITMFMMMYGYISLLSGYTTTPFTGRPDEIIVVIFISFLFFYLCKSAPGLAQSLLTGTPSLSAAGAISAAAGAVMAGAKAVSLGKQMGGKVAGGLAKTAFGGAGMLSQAMGAMQGAKDAGGSKADQRGAFMSSVGNSTKQAMLAGGGNLARSLLGGGKSGGGSGAGGGSGGINKHDQLQQHLSHKDAAGNRESMKDYMQDRKSVGQDMGRYHMHNKKPKQEKKE